MHPAITIDTMHRLVLVLVLLLLPSQASWAAVAAYCGHEKGIASKHVGHHQHKHQVSSNDESGDSSPGTRGIDKDCGTCHINLDLVLPTVVMPLLDDGSQSERHRLLRQPYSSFIPRGPERPNWRVFA